MAEKERFSFGDTGAFLSVMDVGTLAISSGVFYSANRLLQGGGGANAVDVEPSKTDYADFDNRNRALLSAVYLNANTPDAFTVQMQFARKDSATLSDWTDIGDAIEPCQVHATLAQAGFTGPNLMLSPFPADLMTDASIGTDIDDTVWVRSKWTGPDITGTYAYSLVLIPSLGGAGAVRGRPGNAFSGQRY